MLWVAYAYTPRLYYDHVLISVNRLRSVGNAEMLFEQLAKLGGRLAVPDFHPLVQKSILRLILLRDGVSPVSILEEIAPWSPPEQLFHLEFLILRISKRISQAITCEPQKHILRDGNCYWMDFKLSLRDEVFTSLRSRTRQIRRWRAAKRGTRAGCPARSGRSPRTGRAPAAPCSTAVSAWRGG